MKTLLVVLTAFNTLGSVIASAESTDRSCGAFALHALATRLAPHTPQLPRLLTAKAPPEGFSLRQLQQISAECGLELIAVEPADGHQAPIPAVAHVHPNHFVALLSRAPHGVEVYDPATDTTYWQGLVTLEKRLSGRFLIPANHLGPGLKPLSLELASEIRGAVIVDAGLPADAIEEDCPKDEFENESKCPTEDCDECRPGNNEPDDASCSSCGTAGPDHSGFAMPVWRVSEPNINLWLIDKPMFYTTSHDDLVVFTLTYKQRNTDEDTSVEGVSPHY